MCRLSGSPRLVKAHLHSVTITAIFYCILISLCILSSAVLAIAQLIDELAIVEILEDLSDEISFLELYTENFEEHLECMYFRIDSRFCSTSRFCHKCAPKVR